MILENEEGPLVNIISVPKARDNEPHSLIVEARAVSSLLNYHCFVFFVKDFINTL